MTASEAEANIVAAVDANAGSAGDEASRYETARYETVGTSEEGRSILGIVAGSGPTRVSLVGGAHADEPVGPELLRSLIPVLLDGSPGHQELLRHVTFFIVPHINPDGEARNRKWIDAWPDLASYLNHVVREKPGRDMEFGYPDMRMENVALSAWLRSSGPFQLHMSLHGMGYSDGAMLLIEKNWSYRTEQLQGDFTRAADSLGLRLHDHNRKGGKGFFQIAPGFTTTPEGVAMRTYFNSHSKPDTAALFGDSSMEFVRGLGGDPLSVVTELPLFVVEGGFRPGEPTAYLECKALLPEIRLRAARGENIAPHIGSFGLKPLKLSDALRLQCAALVSSIETVLPEEEENNPDGD